MSEVKPFKYLDHPDGEEVGKKLWYVLNPTTKIAGMMAITDVLLYSHPKGYAATIGRMAAVAGPIIGVAATTVIVMNVLGSIRKTDDRTNWFVGGLAGGAVIGAAFRRPYWGFNSGMALGLAMFFRKDMHQKFGETVFKPTQTLPNNVWSVHQDWTIAHDPPKHWRTQ